MSDRVNELTLQEITEFYRDNFVGKVLRYDVRHKSTPFLIKFDEGHLMHLLGLHKFGYKRGEKIYKDLLRGKISYKTLNNRDEGRFKAYHFRMKYFCFLTEVMENSRIAIYDPKRTESRINADFIFYNQVFDRFLSLGIRKEKNDSEFYIPVTFLEHEKNKWINQTHILHQTK
ncbi:PBECR4 domain-containing protein [uncultured Marinococcus sp.]|uniref:PBECR4 domain-containing protein n=1 Tax=uncultured Marinococcus sp. TaxID=487012 RepID=UPI002601D230|nr:PBECR4 domain-containing protein [uncultured Marinococcus sp.]